MFLAFNLTIAHSDSCHFEDLDLVYSNFRFPALHVQVVKKCEVEQMGINRTEKGEKSVPDKFTER